jgi:hypothetical protein
MGATAAALAALLVAATGWAVEPVGSVAALEGRAEVQHADSTAWAALAAGDGVFVADHIRTLEDSRLKLLFRDDSVLTLAASSELTVDEQAGAAAVPASRFELLFGTLKALVTERYSQPQAKFELETPTAIAGVRGTGFIATYDQRADETLIVGLFDTTLVRAVNDPKAAREVRLGPGESTRVRRGAYPLEPTRLPAGTLRGLDQATSVGPGKGGGGSSLPSAKTLHRSTPEPRLPTSPGEGNAPQQGTVDQPLQQLERSPRGVAPPPPPVPPRR